MAESRLPEAFRELEPFADWALASEAERTRKRQDTPMSEIEAFYDAMVDRIEAVLDYLNALPLDAMPADAERLMRMTLSLAEVGPAVELYGQPRGDDTLDPFRYAPEEP